MKSTNRILLILIRIAKGVGIGLIIFIMQVLCIALVELSESFGFDTKFGGMIADIMTICLLLYLLTYCIGYEFVKKRPRVKLYFLLILHIAYYGILIYNIVEWGLLDSVLDWIVIILLVIPILTIVIREWVFGKLFPLIFKKQGS